MMKRTLGIAFAALALTGAANAANLVSNGDFEGSSYTSNTQFGAGFGGQGVTDWTGAGGNHLQFYYFGGTQTSVNAVNQFGDSLAYFRPNFSSLSPNGGGNFVALDGDSDYDGSISQTISGLTVGKVYKLTFDWAATQLINRSGATTEQLKVTFGGDTAFTSVVANPSEGFTGWFTDSFLFTATSASQTLSFLSIGTPNGLPPIAVLDSVSLTGVPEAATWAMLIAGFGLVGAAARRRRATAVAA